jgi:hypothetical protein
MLVRRRLLSVVKVARSVATTLAALVMGILATRAVPTPRGVAPSSAVALGIAIEEAGCRCRSSDRSGDFRVVDFRTVGWV